tara:strand:+ start:374 stop:703 length:330 start_codon:yes stop_codon:yes gene_type:complete
MSDIPQLVHDLSGCKTGLEFLRGRLEKSAHALDKDTSKGVIAALKLYKAKIQAYDFNMLEKDKLKLALELPRKITDLSKAMQTPTSPDCPQALLREIIDTIHNILAECS